MSNSIPTIYKRFLQCESVTTDSRNCPKESMFIGLRGENFNGSAFAEKAIEAGCACAIIDDATFAKKGDSRYIIVENSLRTLQQLALHHRRQLKTPIIGITGTNGKTTTKELIAAVLSQSYQVLYTQGNLNNAIGVPLTLLKLKREHQIGVIEMGASHPGDIKELVDIAEPNYGIITNVGKAHLQGFGSFEGVIKTKGELYDYLRQKRGSIVFINNDNPYLKEIVHGIKTVSYGTDKGLYVSGHPCGDSPFLEFTWTTVETNDETYNVKTHLIGNYNFENALAAISIGRYFHVSIDKINAAIGGYTPQNNRSQLKQTADNTLIIDAYNANPTSMKAAINNFTSMNAAHKMLILGDMRELGTDSAAEHQNVIDLLEQTGLNDVVLVGSSFAETRHFYPTFRDVTELILWLTKNKPHGKTILIKGSNGIRLNSVIDYL